VLVAGGSPVAAALAGLLVNLRHLPFGFAVADALPRRGLARLVGTHLMTDEATAFTVARTEPAARRSAYWLAGVGLFVCWNAGVALGVLGGRVVGDTDALGLDAAFPAVLLALVLPSLRGDGVARRAVAVGSVVAVAAALVLPSGLPVLAALLGLVAVGRARGPRVAA
jgi:predicted branched-subunit amino acid permease